MWKYVIMDLQNTIQYISNAVLIGCIGSILYLLWCLKMHINMDKNKFILLFLLGTYILMILNIAYFSREPGSREGLDLKLFETWGESLQAKAYVIENILMFIPLGILLPMLWKKMQIIWLCMLTALLTSVSIEVAQYVMKKGYCQLDDVVMNVGGAVIGMGIYYMLRKLRSFIK